MNIRADISHGDRDPSQCWVMPFEFQSSNWSEHAHHWSLDPTVTFLNHGSFGACPTEILAAQSEFRQQMEAEPVCFMTREMQPLLDASRNALAEYLHASADDLAFVTNATTGVNSVLRSITWSPGDELLMTDHTYNACGNVVDFLATRHGVVPVVVSVPLPLQDAAQVTQLVVAAVTSRTRLALIDHVTSATGLVLPIADIVSELAARQVDTFVDGAHAPGMVPLNLNTLGAAYYTGNCHKWLCAPKGAAFLYVRLDKQADVVPAVISHGWNKPRAGRSRYHDLFDWVGTVDPTPWLCVGKAIAFLQSQFAGGVPGVMERNRSNTLKGRAVLMDRLAIDPPCPDSMIGSLAALPLPDDCRTNEESLDWRTVPTPSHPLHSRLLEEYRIEVPVFFWPEFPRRALRISMQQYNTVAQVERLAQIVAELLAQETSR